MNLWNLIGVVAWLLLLAYLLFVIMNIRNRHLRMLVMTQKTRSAKTTLLDIVEVVVLVAAAYGMFWVTWQRPVETTNSADVSVRYTYDKLILQTSATRSYYVTATAGNGKQPVQYYNYWTSGAKYSTNSRIADVSDGSDPLTVRASAYPWQTKQLAKWDKQSEKAFVATFIATYQPNFLNGLGLHVGHTAARFSLIRIPNDTFQKVEAAKEK